MRAGLALQFGALDAERKESNLRDLGAAPFSVVSHHNRMLRQARNAFVIGAYYPALTAACSLGERILNHLMLELRGHYRDQPEYKHVYDKQSFDRWPPVIDILEKWGVLRPETAQGFRALHPLRNDSIHFNPELNAELRSRALEAMQGISSIVELQFGAFGPHPWFIPSSRGVYFLKASSENEPFIRKFYLPSCQLVGPAHRLEDGEQGFYVVDDEDYPQVEMTDEEFLAAFEQQQAARHEKKEQ